MSKFNSSQNIGEMVAAFPKAADVFKAGDKDWREASTGEIVDRILFKHHAYLWAELPKIGKLAITILKVHGGNHTELAKVHKLFNTIKMELEAHLTKEESIQYPAIREYLNSNAGAGLDKAIQIIAELEAEHTAAGDILKELRIVTDNYKIPADACATYESTYAKLQELEDDLFQHINLENNILFPRLRGLKDA